MDRLARPPARSLAEETASETETNAAVHIHNTSDTRWLHGWLAVWPAVRLAQIPPRLRFPIPSQQLQPAQTKCPSFLPASLPLPLPPADRGDCQIIIHICFCR